MAPPRQAVIDADVRASNGRGGRRFLAGGRSFRLGGLTGKCTKSLITLLLI
jgi:hypothetical protein